MDNMNFIGSRDRDKINIHENYQVEYWTKFLGTNREELIKAVSVAGNSANEVKKYFNK
jgi:Protein of unknown function (DUF3606)